MLTTNFRGVRIEMEHNLVSLSKWESVFKKPYLVPNKKVEAHERLFYYDCMVLNGVNLSGMITDESRQSPKDLKEIGDLLTMIQEYCNQERSGSTVNTAPNAEAKQGISVWTSELFYALMAISGVDISAEHWHLSRLIMTLNIITELKSEKKKKPMRESMTEQIDLNEQRLRELNSKG